ncbi:hypothetical protein JCM10296v2_000713 [Rhodotorula toruloides]
MGYLNEDVPSEEMSVVFLPARAAAVAMALSSLSSFAALAMLVRLALAVSEISGEDILLVACCACAFAIFSVSSLTLAVSPPKQPLNIELIVASQYARFLPPPFSRVWQLVSPIISFLIVMWLAGLGLSIALFIEVLHPFMSCDDIACQPHDRDIAIQTLSVLVVALVSCFALAMLVGFDLRTTRHHANVIIYQSELQLRQKLRKQKQELARQAQTVPLLQAGPAWSSDEDVGLAGAGPSRTTDKDATVRAYLARAQQPFSAVDPFLAAYEQRPYPRASSARQFDALLSAQYSEGKKSPRRQPHHRRKSDGTSTSTDSEEEERDREERRRRKRKAHHRSQSKSGRHESDGSTDRAKERRKARKRTASANVVQMADASMAPAAE